ncbi:MAG: class I SAM-dependent methyltransferase [Candidatus Pacearchaeota archaeon]
MVIENELQIEFRYQLPILLRKLGLVDVGVEVGVQTGVYSEIILRLSNLKRLYSIDCWKSFEGYKDIANKNQIKQYYYYLKTIARLFKFGKRSRILRKFSKDAARLFRGNSLDFIYIDAQHSYEGCKEDIELWWPKLKKGGIFAGHDYVNGKLLEGEFGVKRAVDEFIKKEKQKLFVVNAKIRNDSKWPTWYLVKN